jgi:hypothetical protein
LGDYRRAANDQDHWSEVKDEAEKQKFSFSSNAVLQASAAASTSRVGVETAAQNIADVHDRQPASVPSKIEALFQCENGMVAQFADGSVLGPIDGKVARFDSLGEYRQAADDQSQWVEIKDEAEKQRFALLPGAPAPAPTAVAAAPVVRDYSQLPVSAPPRPTPKPATESFISRYVRGDYPLDTSAWMFGILVSAARAGALFGLFVCFYVVFNARGQGLIIALLVLLLADLTVAGWQLIGLYASAKKWVAAGGSKTVTILAVGAVLLIVLFVALVSISNISNGISSISSRNRYGF